MGNRARAVGFLGVLFATTAGSATIDGLDLDLSALSPNGDGIRDSIRVALRYSSSAAMLDSVAFLVIQPGVDTLTVLEARDVPVASPFEWTWGGTTASGAAVPDGNYALTAVIVDSDGSDQADVPVLVDTAGPEFLSSQVTGPVGGYANGDYVQIRATFPETPDSVWVDVSMLDSDAEHYDTQRMEVVAPGVVSVLYRISDENTKMNRADVPLSVTAWDSLASSSELETPLEVCLSNSPPLAGEAVLVTADGDSLVEGFAFTTGDTVRVLACFPATFATDTTVALNYNADFSSVDTEFSPFLNPATIETRFVVALPDSEWASPAHPALGCVQFAYELSADNRTPDGTYVVVLDARDSGCGMATASIRLTLADLGPEAPTLDAFPSESRASSSATLTGRAPGAFRVEIIDVDTDAVLGETNPEPVNGNYSIDVELREGSNRLVAVAYDQYLHASPTSNEISVTVAPATAFIVPDRFFPGGTLRLESLDRIDRLDVDVFNLAGDRVFRASATSPGEVHEFSWDGRNESGHVVGTGAYIARATVRDASGTKTFTHAFVFTRK